MLLSKNSFLRFHRVSSLFLSVFLLFFLIRDVNPLTVYRDQGVFIYQAQKLVEGSSPYAESWDHKGPTVYFLHAIYQIFSFGVLPSPFLETVLFLCSAALMFTGFRMTLKSFSLVFISLIIILPTWLLFHESWGITESIVFPFWFFVIRQICVLFYKNRDSQSIDKTPFTNVVTSIGFSFAVIMGARPNMGIGSLILTIAFLIAAIKLPGLQVLTNLGLGMLLYFTPVSIWLLLSGSWNDFIEQFFLYNVDYSSNANFAEKMSTFSFFTSQIPITFLVLIPMSWILLILNHRTNYWFVLCSIFVIMLEFILVSLSGRTYLHYGLSLISLCLLYATFFFLLIAKKTEKNSILTLSISILILSCLFSMKQLSLFEDTSTVSSFDSEIVSWVKANTRSNESIYIHGAETWILALSERESASKFPYYYPTIQEFWRYNQRDRNLMLNQILESQPAAIIQAVYACDLETLSCPSAGNIDYERRLTISLRDLLMNNYRFIGTIEGFKVYKRFVL